MKTTLALLGSTVISVLALTACSVENNERAVEQLPLPAVCREAPQPKFYGPLQESLELGRSNAVPLYLADDDAVNGD